MFQRFRLTGNIIELPRIKTNTKASLNCNIYRIETSRLKNIPSKIIFTNIKLTNFV